MGFKYFSVMFVFGLATTVMFFTIGYISYTLSPTATMVVLGCVALRWLASNLAITILEEIKKQGYKEEKK